MVDITRARRLCLPAISLALVFGALTEVSSAATRLSDRQLDQVFAGDSSGTGNNNGNGNIGFNNGNNNASSNNGNGNIGSDNGNGNGNGNTFNGDNFNRATVAGGVATADVGLAVAGQMAGNSRSRLLSPLVGLGALSSGALLSRFMAPPIR